MICKNVAALSLAQDFVIPKHWHLYEIVCPFIFSRHTHKMHRETHIQQHWKWDNILRYYRFFLKSIDFLRFKSSEVKDQINLIATSGKVRLTVSDLYKKRSLEMNFYSWGTFLSVSRIYFAFNIWNQRKEL